MFLYPALATAMHLFFFVFEDSYQWMWLRLVTFDVWMAAILAPATYHWIPQAGGDGDSYHNGDGCCCGLGGGGGGGGIFGLCCCSDGREAKYAPLVEEMIHEMPEVVGHV